MGGRDSGLNSQGVIIKPFHTTLGGLRHLMDLINRRRADSWSPPEQQIDGVRELGTGTSHIHPEELCPMCYTWCCTSVESTRPKFTRSPRPPIPCTCETCTAKFWKYHFAICWLQCLASPKSPPTALMKHLLYPCDPDKATFWSRHQPLGVEHQPATSTSNCLGCACKRCARQPPVPSWGVPPCYLSCWGRKSLQE